MTKIGGLLNVLGSVANEALSTVKKQVKAEVRNRLDVPKGLRTRTAIKREAALMVRKDAAHGLSALSARLRADRGSHPEQPGDASRLDPRTAYQAMKAGLAEEVVRHVATRYVPAKLDRLAARLAGVPLTEANLKPLKEVGDPPTAEGGSAVASPNEAGDDAYLGWVETDADTKTAFTDPSKAQAKTAGAPPTASLKSSFSDTDLPHAHSTGAGPGTPSSLGRSNANRRPSRRASGETENRSIGSGVSRQRMTASSVFSDETTSSTTVTEPDSPLAAPASPLARELERLRQQGLVKDRLAQFGNVAAEDRQEAGPDQA